MIHKLLILVFISTSQSASTRLKYLDLNNEPGYFFAEQVMVDYQQCHHSFRDDEYYQDAGCHLTDLEDVATVQERFGHQVPSCCHFDGASVEIGTCRGRSKNGYRAEILNIKVCHNQTYDGIHHPAGNIMKILKNCPEHCNYKSGFLNHAVNVTNGRRPRLKISGRETENFCVARACNDYDYDAGYKWDFQYEACVCDETTEDLEKKQKELSRDFPGKPLCCGAEGLIRDTECHSWNNISAASQEVDPGFSQCKQDARKKTVVIEEEDPLMANATCVSLIKQGEKVVKGGVYCKEACEGSELCISSCHGEGQFWAGYFYQQEAGRASRSRELSNMTGLDLSDVNIDNERLLDCQDGWLASQLYPEAMSDEARNKIRYQQNGTITFPNRGNLTRNFREFCVALNTGELASKRGRLMIQTCLPRQP